MSLVFKRDLKIEYSWLPRGITSSIINQTYSGRNSMIAAFCSDGQYICALINDTINSQCFQGFYELFDTLFKQEVLFQ